MQLGSIIVNPWNTDELANAMYEAVDMPMDTRKANHSKLYRYVTKYTAAYWGLSFIEELRRVCEESCNRSALPRLGREIMLQRFRESKKKKVRDKIKNG